MISNLPEAVSAKRQMQQVATLWDPKKNTPLLGEMTACCCPLHSSFCIVAPKLPSYNLIVFPFTHNFISLHVHHQYKQPSQSCTHLARLSTIDVRQKRFLREKERQNPSRIFGFRTPPPVSPLRPVPQLFSAPMLHLLTILTFPVEQRV